MRIDVSTNMKHMKLNMLRRDQRMKRKRRYYKLNMIISFKMRRRDGNNSPSVYLTGMLLFLRINMMIMIIMMIVHIYGGKRIFYFTAMEWKDMFLHENRIT